MNYANPAERIAYIEGIRKLADYLESNPEVPAPKYSTVYAFPPNDNWDGQRAEIDRVAALLGAAAYLSAGGHYLTMRTFGPVEYRAVAIPSASGHSNSESE